MSVGETVYTSDDRVVVTHKKHSTDWILQFKFAKERDEGMYECQVTIPCQTIKLEHFWGIFSREGFQYNPLHPNGFFKWNPLFAFTK